MKLDVNAIIISKKNTKKHEKIQLNNILITHVTQSHILQVKTALKVCQNDPF